MLRCVLKEAKYEKNPYFVCRRFKGSDDIFDTKTLNLADVSSCLRCVINLLLRIIERVYFEEQILALLLVFKTYNL